MPIIVVMARRIPSLVSFPVALIIRHGNHLLAGKIPQYVYFSPHQVAAELLPLISSLDGLVITVPKDHLLALAICQNHDCNLTLQYPHQAG